MSALSVRDRRAVSVGALLVGAMLTWRAIVAPLSARVDDALLRGDAEAQLLARELTLARDGHALPAQLTAAQQSFAQTSAALATAPDSTAAQRLMLDQIRQASAAAQLTATRVEPAPTDPASGPLMGAQADVRATGDATAIGRWLAAVEQRAPALGIVRLRVDRNDNGSLTLTARVRALTRRREP